ncbi:Lipopolysaccharide export system ATP-binding protein LptB [Burkholderiales bacterium]|nr:MAG: ABC transporter ATP-binding protein [Burkholderiales bacterium]CAG0948226.1 Lipopolysaccharide export system ATP-binding protein LptB [Burkholderiales bacterium]
MIILSVQNLTRRFGGLTAVDDVSLAVQPGTVHAVIGPNGAGKTTLLNLMCGIYTPSAGTIRLGEADVTGAPHYEFARKGLGRTFQTPQIFHNMTALENVMVGRYMHEQKGLFLGLAEALMRLPGLRTAERQSREEAAELMRAVGLERYLDADADALPYGALKRLEIARALALQPKLLLLDEPAAGLNHSEAVEIEELIGHLVERGMTVVLVEHNMRLVMGVSDAIFVLDHGRRLAEGTPMEVRENSCVIEAYLGKEAAQDAACSVAV